MELDFLDSETPPSSPIIGYTAIRDFETEEYSFECKGSIRPNDTSFSPKGLIARGDLTCTIKQLSSNCNLSFDRSDPNLNPFDSADGESESNYKFFNFPFEPTQETLILFIHICRKNISSLENLAQPSHSLSGIDLLSSSNIISNNNNNNSGSNDEDSQNGGGSGSSFSKPWDLRRDVGIFLNFILTHTNGLKQINEDFVSLFNGLKNSLEKIENWPVSLRSHAGSFEGNKCTSPFYHFFHLNLELRWFFLILTGVNPTILEWILDDLTYLAWFNYASEKSDWCSSLSSRVSGKVAFNCYCVKELWTMICHVTDEIKPQGKDFWDFLTAALNRFEKNGNDLLFPLWLVVNVAPLRNYSLQGQFSLESDFTENCYPFVKNLLDSYLEQINNSNNSSSRGSEDLSQVIELLYKLLPFWGNDDKVILTIWEFWAVKIDKKGGVQEGNYWKSPVKWISLIKSLTDSDHEDPTTTIADLGADDFHQFVRLFAGHVKYYRKESKLSKLTVKLYLKFPETRLSTLNSELGLIRWGTLHLAILQTIASSIHRHDRSDLLTACKRFVSTSIDVFDILMKKNRMNWSRTVLSSLCTMFLLLLEKSIVIPSDLTSRFMDQVNNLMLKDSNIQLTSKKELVMLYFEFLDAFPKFSHSQSQSYSHSTQADLALDLGQSSFYCPNICIWLPGVSLDYANRALRTLHNLCIWQFETNNVCPDLVKKIYEGTRPFVSDLVCRVNINKVSLQVSSSSSSTSSSSSSSNINTTNNKNQDVEPLCELAADFAYFNRHCTSALERDFDLFALDARTSPDVSQCYVEKILSFDQASNNKRLEKIDISDLKLIQAWIRLVCVGVTVPHKLTMSVLNSGGGGDDDSDDEGQGGGGGVRFLGHSNESLLAMFCRDASGNEGWERKDIDTILVPFLRLCERRWTPVKDHLSTIQNILKSGIVIWQKLRLNKIYVANWPKSPAQIILNTFNEYLYPVPSELIRSMANFLPQIFQAITSNSSWRNDLNLKSFITNILSVSFTSFTRDDLLRNFEAHPCVKILKLAVSESMTDVIDGLLPEMKTIASEQRLNNAAEYLKTLNLFRQRSLGLGIIIAKSVPVLLRIVRLSVSPQDLIVCTDLICSLFDPTLQSQLKLTAAKTASPVKGCSSTSIEEILKSALEREMDQNLSLHSKKYFALFRKMMGVKTSYASEVRSFMKTQLCTLVSHQIAFCEAKRGFGQDFSLRNQLQTLEAELNRYS